MACEHAVGVGVMLACKFIPVGPWSACDNDAEVQQGLRRDPVCIFCDAPDAASIRFHGRLDIQKPTHTNRFQVSPNKFCKSYRYSIATVVDLQLVSEAFGLVDPVTRKQVQEAKDSNEISAILDQLGVKWQFKARCLRRPFKEGGCALLLATSLLRWNAAAFLSFNAPQRKLTKAGCAVRHGVRTLLCLRVLC